MFWGGQGKRGPGTLFALVSPLLSWCETAEFCLRQNVFCFGEPMQDTTHCRFLVLSMDLSHCSYRLAPYLGGQQALAFEGAASGLACLGLGLLGSGLLKMAEQNLLPKP